MKISFIVFDRCVGVWYPSQFSIMAWHVFSAVYVIACVCMYYVHVCRLIYSEIMARPVVLCWLFVCLFFLCCDICATLEFVCAKTIFVSMTS